MFISAIKTIKLNNQIRKLSVPASVLEKISNNNSNYDKINLVETILKYVGGTVFAPCGFFTVPVNHVVILSRYGKYDGYRTEGLRWTSAMSCKIHKIFCGDMNHTMKEMHITDSVKNPIIVSAFVTYNVTNPVNKVFNVPNDDVLFNLFEQEVRTIVSSYSYDQLTSSIVKEEITDKIMERINSNQKMELYGVNVQKVGFLEVNYSKQIAETMLVKQRANATMEARQEIVETTLDIVKKITNELGDSVNKEDKSKLTTYLITALVSNQPISPVINVN